MATLGILDLYEDASAVNIPTTPIISTRGHFDLGSGALINPSPTSYETNGDIPGLEDGGCPDSLVVYVHGFDNTADSAIGKFNIAKKSFDFNGFTQPVVGFSWDSNTGLLFGFNTAKFIAEQNGLKLGQFFLDFKNACSNSDIRLVGHSLGPRVIFFTLTSLNANAQWNNQNYQITSVHLLGAAVDNEFVSLNPSDGKGIAIEAVTCEFQNKFDPEDDVLEIFYIIEEFDIALGEDGAELGIPLPENYREQNVQLEISRDIDGDGINDLANLGDNHFGYVGVVNAAGVLTSDGAMDIVVKELRKKTWDGEGNDGDWSNPLNWSCDTLPKGSENIEIDATLELDNTIHLDTNFQLDSGNLTVLGGIFLVDGGFTLSNLSEETITINSQSTLMNSGNIVNFGTLDNAGTINNNPGAALIATGTGVINNNAGGTINNMAGATLQADSGGIINNLSATTISNGGTLLVLPGSVLNNIGPGMLTNQDGGLIVVAAAAFNNNAGATFQMDTNSVAVNLASGTITNNAGGTIAGGGIIFSTGAGTSTINTGDITINSGGAIVSDQGATMTNNGGGTITLDAGAAVVTQNGSTLNNAGGTISSNALIYSAGAGTNTINIGLIQSGNGAFLINDQGASFANNDGGNVDNGDGSTFLNLNGSFLENNSGGTMANALNGVAFNGAGSTTNNNVGATIDNDNGGFWFNDCIGTFNDLGTFFGTLIQLPCVI